MERAAELAEDSCSGGGHPSLTFGICCRIHATCVCAEEVREKVQNAMSTGKLGTINATGVRAGVEWASQPLLASLSGARLPRQEGCSNAVQEGAAGSAELWAAQQRPADDLHCVHR